MEFGLWHLGQNIHLALMASVTQPNFMRIVEALIVAGITAGVTVYAAEKVVENQIQTLKEADKEAREDSKDVVAKVNALTIEVARLREKLDAHDQNARRGK